MEPCQTGPAPPRGPWLASTLALGLALAAGCASAPPRLDPQLHGDRAASAPGPHAGDHYAIACPDVLDVRVDDRPTLVGERAVGTDGRIDLGAAGRVRVEGQTTAEAAATIGEALGLPPARVRVRVAQFNSQRIYVTGEVAGRQRSIPYEGREAVVDVLRRAGGITAGAEPNELYLVRAHVDDGAQPEVYHVNLRAALERREENSNVWVEPFDVIYLAETKESRVRRCVAPCLRPAYAFLCRLPWLRKTGQDGNPGESVRAGDPPRSPDVPGSRADRPPSTGPGRLELLPAPNRLPGP